MKKNTKVVIVAITIIIVIASIAGIVTVHNYQARIAAEEQAKSELQLTYRKQQTTFCYDLPTLEDGSGYKYGPFVQDAFDRNTLLIKLGAYNKNEKKALTVEEIEEYLSQEYEEDGSVRVYTNGLHPDIQEYVEWAWRNGDSISNSPRGIYQASLRKVYREHTNRNPTKEYPTLLYLPEEDLKQIIAKEADPSVELNLSVG